MAKPLATRRSRQAGLFIGFWIFCFISIVVDSTSRIRESPEEYALILGRVYTQGHRSLTEFAATATVSGWVPLFVYFILANLAVLVSLFVLEVYTLDETYFGFIESYFYLIVGGILVGAFGLYIFTAVAITINFSGGTLSIFGPVTQMIGFVLDISPQALVLSGYLVAISFLTPFVP